MSNNDKISSIIAQWKESQKYEWNILESIRINENAHTNILSDILKIEVNGKRVFLETFITNVLKIKGFANSQRISKNKNSYEELDVKTQVQAISKKKCGYIDLLIEDVKNEKVIIIENKMCGAGDCEKQLQRYWCTYAKHNPVLHKDFKEAYENFKEKKEYFPKNVFIVYLTADEDQKPEVDEKWMNIWKKTFRQISSTEIIEWLQQTVLTNMPYFQNGYASQSVKLYLEILAQSFCPENRWSKEQVETINKIIFGKQSTPNKKSQFKTYYKYAQDIYQIPSNNQEECSPNVSVLNDLHNFFKWSFHNVFQPKDTEWTVISTPTYITFYPTKWLKMFGGVVTCNIHWEIRNWQNSSSNHQLRFSIHNSATKYFNENLQKELLVYSQKKEDNLIVHRFPDGKLRYWNMIVNDNVNKFQEIITDESVIKENYNIEKIRLYIEEHCK